MKIGHAYYYKDRKTSSRRCHFPKKKTNDEEVYYPVMSLSYGSKCTHAHTLKGMPAELELRIA